MGDFSSDLIVAIDSGTTSSRIIIYNLKTGEIETVRHKDISQMYPRSGWVEQDPEQIFSAAVETLEEAVQDVLDKGYRRENIKCVGITNQRETTIVWDKYSGKPLYNAIVWSDSRTADLVKKFIAMTPDKKDSSFMKIVGLPLSTYFSALKLCWLLKEVPAVKTALDNKQLLFGTVDSWLIWKLTSGLNHITDVTNASRTMLMNLSTLSWDNDMCKFFNIDKTILPNIMSSSEMFGIINISNTKSLINGLPITGILGDQQASLVGQSCTSFGKTKCTYGTGAFLLMNIGQDIQFSTHGLLTTVAYQFGSKSKPHYAFEGSIPVAAGAINWLVDNLGLFTNINTDLDKMVLSVKDNGGCYFVPAFNGLFCPYWRSDARGVIVGLSQTVTKNHLCRATLESLAFQTKDILNAIKVDSESSNKGLILNGFRIDGGVTKSDCFNQILADICGIAVQKPSSVEATALGAAIAAVHGLGLDPKTLETSNLSIFSPTLSQLIVDYMYKEWKKAVQKSFN